MNGFYVIRHQNSFILLSLLPSNNWTNLKWYGFKIVQPPFTVYWIPFYTLSVLFTLLLFEFHFKGEVLLRVEAAHRNKTCMSTAGTFFFNLCTHTLVYSVGKGVHGQKFVCLVWKIWKEFK